MDWRGWAVVLFTTIGASAAGAEEWTCMVTETCDYADGCVAIDPPFGFGIKTTSDALEIEIGGYTAEAKQIGEGADSRSFASFDDTGGSMVTLFNDGRLIRSDHVLDKDGLYGGGYVATCERAA